MSRPTQDTRPTPLISDTRLSLSMVCLPKHFSYQLCLYASPTTPLQKPGTVWAIPLSLAATNGVSFDFLSSGYLDVSVPQVGTLAGDEG